MKLRFFRLPVVARWLYPKAIVTTGLPGKTICLSFDDGPNLATTPIILEILKKHHIRALFFCLGKNAQEYPDLVKEIKNQHHIVGNHGFEHLNGLKTSFPDYLQNIKKGGHLTSLSLLRPPYGKLTIRQYRELIKTHAIVLWDLMPYDFDNTLSAANVITIIDKKVRDGSIIVLHDRPGCCSISILEEVISRLKSKGFEFVLPPIV